MPLRECGRDDGIDNNMIIIVIIIIRLASLRKVEFMAMTSNDFANTSQRLSKKKKLQSDATDKIRLLPRSTEGIRSTLLYDIPSNLSCHWCRMSIHFIHRKSTTRCPNDMSIEQHAPNAHTELTRKFQKTNNQQTNLIEN